MNGLKNDLKEGQFHTQVKKRRLKFSCLRVHWSNE